MKDWLNKLRALSVIFAMIVLPLIIGNAVFYFIGAFIAGDWNPSNWWILKSTVGRVIIVIFELGILSSVPKFWEDLDL
jgi:hypothetical protein